MLPCFFLRKAALCLYVSPGTKYTQYSLHNVHLQYPWVMNLTKHPRILQVITAVLGLDVILLDSRFICKYPTPVKPAEEEKIAQSNGHAEKDELPYVAWHQDMRSILLNRQRSKHVFVLLSFVSLYLFVQVLGYRWWPCSFCVARFG